MENKYMNLIGGYDYQKEEAIKLIDFFKNYEIYIKNGASLPRGVLFYGSPGNGKTTFANAIIKDSGVNSFSLSDSLYENGNTKICKELVSIFNKAKENAPSVILLDEIDQLIGTSNTFFGKSENEKEILRILLTEIDKLEGTGVLVVATGNLDMDELPPSLTRNGRLEKHIFIGTPDFEDRSKILNLFLSKSTAFKNIKPCELANLTQGFTCADLKSLVNDVLVKSLSCKKEYITYQDFHDPIQVISSDGIKTKPTVNNDDVIYHEVGHLIVDYVLNDSIGFLSVESYGNSSGSYRSLRTHGKLDEDKGKISTIADVKNRCTVLIAGLASTDVFLGQKHAGAVSDLKKIFALYNFSALNGLLSFEEFVNVSNQTPEEPFGQKTVKVNEKNFSQFLNEIYEKAVDILKSKEDLVKKLYIALKTKRTLTSEEVSEIIESDSKK